MRETTFSRVPMLSIDLWILIDIGKTLERAHLTGKYRMAKRTICIKRMECPLCAFLHLFELSM